MSNKKDLKFNVFITARNGFTRELLRMKRIDNEWVRATKVLKTEKGEDITLFEEIDENYPRNEKGDVNWVD